APREREEAERGVGPLREHARVVNALRASESGAGPSEPAQLPGDRAEALRGTIPPLHPRGRRESVRRARWRETARIGPFLSITTKPYLRRMRRNSSSILRW